MKNLKIATRLGLLLALLALLLVMLGVVGLRGLAQTQGALQTVYEDRTVAIAQLSQVQRRLQGSQIAVYNAMSATPEAITSYLGEIDAHVDLHSKDETGQHEQTQGIGQVGDAVTQLDQVTQQNAALVEESAAAAESLNQQAARLVQAVSVFKLDQGAAQPVLA